MVTKSQLISNIHLVVVDSKLVTADTSDAEIKGIIEVFSAILYATRDEQKKLLDSKRVKRVKRISRR